MADAARAARLADRIKVIVAQALEVLDVCRGAQQPVKFGLP